MYIRSLAAKMTTIGEVIKTNEGEKFGRGSRVFGEYQRPWLDERNAENDKCITSDVQYGSPAHQLVGEDTR